MATLKPFIVLALAATVGLSACSRKDGKLMNLRSASRGPDEFAVVPTKPLQAPKSYTVLPKPTPGGKNLVDPTPLEDAAVALGGSRRAFERQGIAARDKDIVAAASRYGVNENIRAELAVQDKEFRKKHRGKLLERLFGNTVYFSAYKKQSLDRYKALEKARAQGLRNPAAPPGHPKK